MSVLNLTPGSSSVSFLKLALGCLGFFAWFLSLILLLLDGVLWLLFTSFDSKL